MQNKELVKNWTFYTNTTDIFVDVPTWERWELGVQKLLDFHNSCLRPAGSDPKVVCQKDSFLKVSVSLGGFGPSVAHGKHSVRRRCVQATKKQGRNLLSP